MTKTLLALALCAAQVATAAEAADLSRSDGIAQQARGSFAGARLRLPLGGRDSGKARLSLTLAPVERSRSASGAERLRFAEGVELGVRGGEPVKLRLAGATVGERLNALPRGEQERRQKKAGKVILKGAAIAAITAVAVVGGLFLFYSVACAGERCDD